MRLLFALFLLVFTALVVVATHARATVFDPTQQITLQQNSDLSLATPALNEGGYYHNLLNLQRQLFLLRKLVEREKRNFALTEDYQKIGLSFKPTAPNADLCRQVPANLSCAEFFASLYPNFPPVGSSQGSLPDMPLLASSVGTIPEGDLPFLPTVADIEDTRDILNWLDITCLGQKCSAVVTPDSADRGARYRVYVGDTLPNGDKISAISAQGVQVTNSGGRTRTIDPAPKAGLQALR
jgi:hypothetical protein